MKRIKGLLIALVLSLVLAVSVKAAPVPIITYFSLDFLWASANYSLGYRFTAEDDLFVTALGFYDYQDDGLARNYPVGIWDVNGTLLDSVLVQTGSPLISPFRYADLDSPLLLTAGSDYYLATTVYGRDSYYIQTNTIDTDPRITYVDSYWAGTEYELQFPTALSPEINDYMLVNALVEAVPIPGAIWLLGAGLVALVGIRRKFKE